MHPSTSPIGFWAAVLATISGLGYIAALFATLANMLEAPWDTAYQLTPSIVLAWCYMALMACVLDAAPEDRRIWATIAFGFALMYAAMNSIVYFTELTVVIPHILSGDIEAVSVLLFEPGEFLFAVNGLAYGFMSAAALFASPVFRRKGLEARVRWALAAHGLIGPFIVGPASEPPWSGSTSERWRASARTTSNGW